MADLLAAENTDTPAIMCDIEGDFRLTSKDLCLKGIRKRLVLYLFQLMKAFICLFLLHKRLYLTFH